MEINELSANAKGGTEQMMERLHQSTSPEVLNEFQIIPSRVRSLDDTKIRIFWAHDLPGDPEATKALGNNGWNRFHQIVFVSNWQMQNYISMYDIPWSKCVVLHNAIVPIEPNQTRYDPDTDNKIRLIYHTTPHRGLNILLPVFEKLAAENDRLVLDVYSSFGVYGWTERDEEFSDLFDFCRRHPQVNYHGAVSNDEVRTALATTDIFAYPSIWPETSCLALIEAMSAGCVCVHSNYGALYETAGNYTYMYQFQEEVTQHAGYLYSNLKATIDSFGSTGFERTALMSKAHADSFYNWSTRALQWESMLKSLISRNPDRTLPSEQFVYRR
jgi:UDP-glucose:(glucosyl)LPS alpha-1,2-glucosyltransferase